MKNKIITTSLLVIWMLVIFLFSNQNANVSESYSDSVTVKIIDVTTSITKQEISEEEKHDLVEDLRFMIRKTAHFTLYFFLNLIAYFTFKSYGIKKCLVFSVLFCFLYACTDEIHQLFVSERTGKLFDVLVDTSGAICSSLLIKFISFLKNKKANKEVIKVC